MPQVRHSAKVLSTTRHVPASGVHPINTGLSPGRKRRRPTSHLSRGRRGLGEVQLQEVHNEHRLLVSTRSTKPASTSRDTKSNRTNTLTSMAPKSATKSKQTLKHTITCAAPQWSRPSAKNTHGAENQQELVCSQEGALHHALATVRRQQLGHGRRPPQSKPAARHHKPIVDKRVQARHSNDLSESGCRAQSEKLAAP